MAFRLTDDGTLDTVARCTSCGHELRYRFDGELFDGDDVDGAQDAYAAAYDAFTVWAVDAADQDHECDGAR